MNPTPKISLCIIAGNVEQYIERFLESFAPLVDEIVIVSAIGDQSPDETLLRACKGWNIPKATRYVNAPEYSHWPHVDNFAAARNMAFDLASNDWILWADTDDIIDPLSIDLIQSAFQKHHEDFDAFAFDYEVPEDGLCVVRERILRKGCGRWRYPVHEEFKFNDEVPRVLRIRGARIEHRPAGVRTPNDERNLCLLQSIPPEERTLGHRFHLIQSLRALGHADDALREATSLVVEPEIGREEKYELLMNLGEMCPNRAQQGNLYLQAVGVNPARREAYGELALWSVITQRMPEALAFSTAMMALPPPSNYMWNTRPMYYGWFGIRLHAMALRANGHSVSGDVLQFNHFKKHGAKISLLHATRGRPRLAFAMAHKWLSRASDPDAIEHIYALDVDDPGSMPLSIQNAVVLPPGGGCVAAWNAAAERSAGAVLVQMSDDFEPPMHWDKILLERLGDLSASKVLAVSDGGRSDALLCMAILTRARYKAQGYLFHPDFKSMYSDNYFTHCAYRDECVIEARDVVFEHLHPAFGKGEMDETYAASNAAERYAEGLEIFNRLIS